MAKSLGGGRPMSDIWKHVTILDDKRVKCRYCGLAFARKAGRIKSHVSQTEGKGIRVCPQFPQPNTDPNKRLNNNTSSGNVQENLSDSQGSPILGRARDHNKLYEKMLDCYMSPKIMWEGMTQQQVQMNTKIEQERMKQVGPFVVSNTVDARDLQLIEYVFDPFLNQRERVFISSDSYLIPEEISTLKPQRLLDSVIIDIFAEYFTDIERKNKSSNLIWYLPIRFSNWALNMHRNDFLFYVKEAQMREKYMSKLVDCEKIFIPVCTNTCCGHFYLYVIHLKTKEIEIWDSFPSFTNEEEHRERTKKLLLAFTILFADDIQNNGQTFSYLQMTVANAIPLQSNKYDSGIFVIKFMQQSANANINHSPQLFHSDEERLGILLKLLKSDINKRRETLYEKALEQHRLSWLKRKDIHICVKFPKDIQRGEYTILDYSNKRVYGGLIGVQENLDDSNFQGGLEKDTPIYSFSSLYPCLGDGGELPIVEEDSEDMQVYYTLLDALNGWVQSLPDAPSESISSAFPSTVAPVKLMPYVLPTVAPQEKPNGKLYRGVR